MHVLLKIRLMALLGASSLLPSLPQQENWNLCKSDDPERSIVGCSALIQSNQEPGINTADAFYYRGLAYRRKGDYEDASKDFDEALRLNPSFTDAFYQRGSAYAHQRDYVRAIQDYDQTIRLN